MTFIVKPKINYAGQVRNALGLTVHDYEGTISSLCAGCGHDSISSALIQAIFELEIPPHKVTKFSGIGCSSKTPAYFLSSAHGINAVHGRMPAVATGANAVSRSLHCIGVSGDGDSLSIDLFFTQTNSNQDLDLHLYKGAVDLTPCTEASPGTCSTANGQSTTSDETYSYTLDDPACTISAHCPHYVVVHGWAGSVNSYDILIGLDIGP